MFSAASTEIAEAARDVPVGLFCFELLYADGQDLTERSYPERRTRLTEALTLSDRLRLTTALEVATPPALDTMFEQAVADGSEGLVCKSIGPDSVYQAGARGWQWIKLKRDYRTELADTIDLVVVGAYAGRGRRRGTYGAVLLAAYDPETELYRQSANAAPGSPMPSLPRCRQCWSRWLGPSDPPGRLPRPRRCLVRAQPGPGGAQRRAHAVPNHTAGWGSLKMTLGCRYGSPGSPAVGAMTRSRRTRPPINSLSSSTALHGGRRPAEVSAGRHFSACVRYGATATRCYTSPCRVTWPESG